MINKKLFKSLSNIILIFFSLLALDNFIYFFSPYFPEQSVKYLSTNSQIRYKIKNKNDSIFNFEEYIYTLKPNSKIPFLIDEKKVHLKSDEYGYINPVNYLKNIDNLDYLLIGDSFTQYPQFVELLKLKTNLKIYSIGMGGQGMFHWQYQLRKFKSMHKKIKIKNIFLVFYENDLEDTVRATKYLNKGLTNSIYYSQNGFNDNFEKLDRSFSFFHEFYSFAKYMYIALDLRDKIFLKKKQVIQKDSISSDNQTYAFKIKNKLDCLIKFESPFLFNRNYLSEENKIIYKEVIMNVVNQIKMDKTEVTFIYIPSNTTIYSSEFPNNETMKKTLFLNRKVSDYLHDLIYREIDTRIKFLDLTSDLIKDSSQNNLYPCDGSDTHFSSKGYNILTDKILYLLDKNS